MLLWIARPTTSCHKCGATHHMATCNTCHKPVCPICRWGTGEISDGYQCLRCGPLDPDHAFSSEVKKETNTLTRQSRLPWVLLGFMLSSCFWALMWSIYQVFHE
jgi:hypothetical protein